MPGRFPTPEDRIRALRSFGGGLQPSRQAYPVAEYMQSMPHAPIPAVPMEDVQAPEFQMPPEDSLMPMPAAADLGAVKPLSPREAARAEYEDRMARQRSDYAFGKGERNAAYKAGKAQRRSNYEARPGAQPMMVSQFKE